MGGPKQVNLRKNNAKEVITSQNRPVMDVAAFVDDILGGHVGDGGNFKNFRPFSPPAAGLVNLVDPNKTVVTKTKDKTVVMNYTSADSKTTQLVYDTVLQCYVDPSTNTYYSDGK